MASLRGVPWFLLLGVLIHAGRGQRDFDLADALDDPEPTRKPSSDIYPKPKPPYQPQPGNPDNGGNIYPRPQPQPPRPQPGSHGNSGGYFNDIDHNDGGHRPRPRPPAGGSGGHDANYDSYGNTHGGDGASTYGDPKGNTIASIVSPIVSVVVVTLVGAATSYFTYNRRKNCFRTNEPENV
ncbi:glycoprotein Xg isoform 2-T2 [Dugong dugon]